MAPTHVQPDMSLISELLEIIEREPPAIQARKILMQQYLGIGWLEAAKEILDTLKQLDPYDKEVMDWTSALASPKIVIESPKPPSSPIASRTTRSSVSTNARRIAPAVLPTDPMQLAKLRQDMIDGFKDLRIKAASMWRISSLASKAESQSESSVITAEDLNPLQLIAEGKVATAVRLRRLDTSPNPSVISTQPQSVRMIGRLIHDKSPEAALDTLLQDFEAIITWSRSSAKSEDEDAVRATLVKRSQALKAVLPQSLQRQPDIALMHMEHEHLGRNYVTNETMLGDSVADIARENFIASEDNYAWDMDELAQAIEANSGVMRNPLSREMFSSNDIKMIIAHPKGRRLAAMAVEQSRLSQGVRSKTIEDMAALSKVMLEDQSADQIPTRKAVDEFFAYLATLPEAEQTALDKLRVPARDSHTGQAYDATIGDSLRDALGNRQCFHKTGDFIGQAAKYLRKQ